MRWVFGLRRKLFADFTHDHDFLCIIDYRRPVKTMPEKFGSKGTRTNVPSTSDCMNFRHLFSFSFAQTAKEGAVTDVLCRLLLIIWYALALCCILIRPVLLSGSK
jgi:hypothetical protein